MPADLIGLSAIFFFLLIFFTLFILWKSFIVLNGQKSAVIEFLGTPSRNVWQSGFHFLIPFFMKIRAIIDLRQQQIERSSKCKTKDNVFVEIKWVARFHVVDSFAFVYNNDNPIENLLWQIENDLRQIASTKNFEELYSDKNTIAQGVQHDMSNVAQNSGMVLDTVLVEQPIPPDAVEKALNAVTAARAEKDAAQNLADAQKIKLIGVAEAQKESKRLQGEGIAEQRNAIAVGLKESIETMRLDSGLSQKEIVDLLMKTIDADMVTTSALNGNATLMVVPYNYAQDPASISTLPVTANIVKK
ncbi:hypothetical protein FAI40_05415 [Acetobacteraceae bacterium]|nr:hypothetical protein FAI40_05415 [Acetobacteraceae bacterium]